jgi:hypothetical protein
MRVAPLAAAALAAHLSGCHDNNVYHVGGTVSGLVAGHEVTLLNNGGDATTLAADGPLHALVRGGGIQQLWRENAQQEGAQHYPQGQIERARPIARPGTRQRWWAHRQRRSAASAGGVAGLQLGAAILAIHRTPCAALKP